MIFLNRPRYLLAQQSADYQQFCEKDKVYVNNNVNLSDGFFDDVFAFVKLDDKSGAKLQCYAQNVESMANFTISSIMGLAILIAALFLLGTNIKLHRTNDGKWEFDMEHEAVKGAVLEKSQSY